MRLALVALVLALSACTPVFFQPTGTIYSSPGIYGIDYQPVEFRAADGTALFAWFMPARGEAHGTVLYLHGNAQNISAHFANVAWMPAAGFNVLAFDYRGYGGSQGRPTLAGVQLDIDAAMRLLIERPDVDADRIIVFGQSLGGALAIYYVAHSEYRSHIRAVIADSAFADYRQVAREKMADFFMTWPLLPNVNRAVAYPGGTCNSSTTLASATRSSRRIIRRCCMTRRRSRRPTGKSRTADTSRRCAMPPCASAWPTSC